MNTPFSGPVSVPLSLESQAIQAAPAYNMEEAKKYIPVMPRIRSLIDGLPQKDTLACFGPAVPSADTLRTVEAEIRRILADGHKISLLLADPVTCSGLSFRSAQPMCTQSTVKAIYVGALLSRFPRAFEENGQYIRDTLVLSSNEAYENLREIYGPEPIRTWCRETGVDEAFADLPYPRAYTARDMLKLWTRLYVFLNDGSDLANAGRYCADSAMSAAAACLGSRCPVQTKAGWENGVGDEPEDYEHAVIPAAYVDGDPLNDECATNDTGIVYTQKGPYLFVLYSDYPCPWTYPNQLLGLTEALYAVRMSWQS